MKRYVSLASAILVGTVVAKKESNFREVAKVTASAEVKAVEAPVLAAKNVVYASDFSVTTNSEKVREHHSPNDHHDVKEHHSPNDHHDVRAHSPDVRAATSVTSNTTANKVRAATSVTSNTTANKVRAATSVTSNTTVNKVRAEIGRAYV